MAQPHAFISYIRENSNVVDRLAKDLRSYGVKVWLDRNNIMPGQRWKYAINEAIRNGAFFIACFSKELIARRETYMHGELRLAIDRLRNMPIDRVWFIPVLINQTEIPPHRISDDETLNDFHAIALYEDWGESLKKILQAMKMDDPEYGRALILIDFVRFETKERAREIEQLVELSARVPGVAALAASALADTLRDVDNSVRRNAATALRRIGPAPIATCGRTSPPRLGKSARLPPPFPSLPRRCATPMATCGLRLLDRSGSSGRPEFLSSPRRCAMPTNLCAGPLSSRLERLGRPSPRPFLPWPRRYATATATCATVPLNSAGKIGPTTAEAIPFLAETLRHADKSLRELAVNALGKIGSAAVPALAEALRDGDSDVRNRAAEIAWEDRTGRRRGCSPPR